ncbi:hypothetical protein RHGRI_005840 [Rhododendron griersonianum]|uniref:Uncharacterized protein n=1 Tax=Rhododendron griersonianum TaxID=479676 RepID=A0AAV6LDN0_9ERIC|nr:hypothetical protein RHGRI_005840 [Rhododendron griersonianum]
MDTIKHLLEIKIVKDNANVKNRKGFTALDFVEHCPNRNLNTMEILQFLFQAGLCRPAYGGSNLKPESLPDNPPPPPFGWRRKAGEVLQNIYLFWIKYFKVNHTWLRELRFPLALSMLSISSARVDVVGVLILAPNMRRRSNFSNMRIRDHGVDMASLQ